MYIYSSKNRFQQSYLPWKGSVWNMKMKNIYIALRGKLIFIQIFSLSNKYWCLNTVPAILRDEEKIQYKSLHSAAPHITSIKIKHNICLFFYISVLYNFWNSLWVDLWQFLLQGVFQYTKYFLGWSAVHLTWFPQRIWETAKTNWHPLCGLFWNLSSKQLIIRFKFL